MLEDDLLTATALFTRHDERLRAWGINGQDRYNRALALFIAVNMARVRRETMNEVLLTAIHNRAIRNRDELLANVADDLSEDDQQTMIDKVKRYQDIANRASEALTNG